MQDHWKLQVQNRRSSDKQTTGLPWWASSKIKEWRYCFYHNGAPSRCRTLQSSSWVLRTCVWLAYSLKSCRRAKKNGNLLRTVIIGSESSWVPPKPKTILPRYLMMTSKQDWDGVEADVQCTLYTYIKGSGQIFLRVSFPTSGKETILKNFAKKSMVTVASI